MTTAEVTLMTVGQLSRWTGVSIKSLREYTDWGIIDTLGRSGANYRLYNAEALRCVRFIGQARRLGLTLAEIRALARSYPDENGQLIGPRLARRLRDARERVDRQIAALEQTRGRIDAFEAAHRAELAGQCGADTWTSEPCASCA